MGGAQTTCPMTRSFGFVHCFFIFTKNFLSSSIAVRVLLSLCCVSTSSLATCSALGLPPSDLAVNRNPLFQEANRSVQDADMALDGCEVSERIGVHEDDLLLRPGFVVVVIIALIFSRKRTYRGNRTWRVVTA